jgi:hypothetical protein
MSPQVALIIAGRAELRKRNEARALVARLDAAALPTHGLHCACCSRSVTERDVVWWHAGPTCPGCMAMPEVLGTRWETLGLPPSLAVLYPLRGPDRALAEHMKTRARFAVLLAVVAALLWILNQ